MNKLFRKISQSKKILALIIGLGLILTLLPLQNIAQADCDNNCTECINKTECETSNASCFWNDEEERCESAGCVMVGEQEIGNWCPGCGWNPASWLTCFSCVVQSIFSLPVRLAFFLLAVIIGIFGLLSGFFFSVAVSLMNWMEDVFLEIPITPANQAMSSDFVVRVGWEFSRDFVNMLFILILVFIGLATILKLREYEAKKILPSLIIIALLINFSAVIVGFVVDMGNILTKFFLDQAGEYIGLGEIWKNSSTYLIDSMKAVFTLDGKFFQNFGETIGSFLGIIAYGLILIVFYGFATLIYFIIMLIFFFRILVLWILTILAPFAFACYILPATKRWWNEWWQQLIQWSIIGIPIGFFLWISNWIMKNTAALEGAELFNRAALESGLSCQFAILIGSILAPTIAIVILGIGALISMQLAPAGASGIINFGKSVPGRIARMRPVALGLGRAAGGTAGLISGAAAGARRLEERARERGKIWGTLAKPMAWMTRGVQVAVGPRLERYAAGTRRINYDELFKGMEAGEIARAIEGLSTKEDRVTAAAWMAEKGLIDKPGISEEFKTQRVQEAATLTDNPAYQKSIGDILESLPNYVTENILVKLDPDKKKELEEEFNNLNKEISVDVKLRTEIENQAKAKGVSLEEELKNVAAQTIFIRGLKSGDVKDIDKKAFESVGVRRGMRKWSSAHLSALVNNFKTEDVRKALDRAGGLNAMFKDKSPEEASKLLEQLYKDNPRLIHFFARTPAGREWNWEGLKYMRDPLGRLTNSFNDFEKRMRITEELDKAPDTLKSFNKLHDKAADLQRRIELLQMRGQPTNTREKQLITTLKNIASKWQQIEKSETLRNKWLEIEKLRNPQQAETLRRNMEAGLRIEGILNTNPDLYIFDRLHQIAERYRQQIAKARRLGKPTDWLEQHYATVLERLYNKNEQVQTSDELREKWGEVERLRKLPQRAPRPRRRRRP